MTLTLDEVVEAADLQLHPDTRREVDPATRVATLREELAWAVDTATTDLDFARDYRHHMPHPGTSPQDYLNRWVTIAPDLQVLLGPRHRARDLARPFFGYRMLEIGTVPDSPWATNPGSTYAILVGEDGSDIVITQIDPVPEGGSAYPLQFHFGLMQDTAEAVNAKHAELVDAGFTPGKLNDGFEVLGATWTAF